MRSGLNLRSNGVNAVRKHRSVRTCKHRLIVLKRCNCQDARCARRNSFTKLSTKRCKTCLRLGRWTRVDEPGQLRYAISRIVCTLNHALKGNSPASQPCCFPHPLRTSLGSECFSTRRTRSPMGRLCLPCLILRVSGRDTCVLTWVRAQIRALPDNDLYPCTSLC
jgi:hypothetical protein